LAGVAALYLAAGLLGACGPKAGAPPGDPPTSDPPTSEPPTATSGQTASPIPSFANRVWKVSRSSGVEVGMLYVFLSDGTLLVASAHGTPALGRWRIAGDTLTLIEEGLPHAAAIVELEPSRLSLLLTEGGTPLDITLVPGAAR
jgi:hypothetical protein